MVIVQRLLFWLLAISLNSLAIAQQSPTDRSIAEFQARASRSQSAADYDRLGAAYLQKGRETFDFAYYELAENALAKSLELMSPADMSAVGPLTHLSAVCMGEHRFSDAAGYANRALALGSGDLSAFGLLGDAHADMGDYDEAAKFYEKLVLPLSAGEVSPGLSYMHDSRVSYLRFIHGDNAGTIELAQGSVHQAIAMHLPAENVAWTYFQLGEFLFQAGDLRGAETAYRAALDTLPNFFRGLSGLAKVRVAEQKYEEAIDLYKKAIEQIPFPEFIASLGDINAKLGRSEEARKRYELVEYIGYLNKLNKNVYNRELAAFYADHDIKLNESLELAKRELEVRRDVYTEDVLAWALYKNGKLKEAADVMDKALSLGTKDSLLYFHAGLIHKNLGQLDLSREYLLKALAINPRFHIFYADIASRTLAEMQTKRTTN